MPIESALAEVTKQNSFGIRIQTWLILIWLFFQGLFVWRLSSWGALARFSPIVNEVISFAKKGGLLLGICNGFQILTECGLLPGTLLMNESLLFICKHQYIRVETEASPFTQSIGKGKVLDVPIAHKEGNFYTDSETLKQLQDNNQIIFRYCDKQGEINLQSNPNGSLDNIAGICNPQRNILG